MNRTMGRFIDEATDEVRDRLVTADDFNDGEEWSSLDGCGCLVGTAAGGQSVYVALPEEWHRFNEAPGTTMRDVPWPDAPASIRYPKAVARFGKARVVRAIKLRASATMSSEVERAGEVVCG